MLWARFQDSIDTDFIIEYKSPLGDGRSIAAASRLFSQDVKITDVDLRGHERISETLELAIGDLHEHGVAHVTIVVRAG